MLRYFLLLIFVFAGAMNLQSQKLRENICFGLTNGLVVPGPLSHGGSYFTGYETELVAGYVWPSVKSHWGMESDVGFARIKYVSKFDKNLFLSYKQTSVVIDLLAFVKISQSLQLKAGLNCFLSNHYMVLASEKNNATQYSFSNVDLNSGYDPTKFQAGAVVGLEYLIGKKQNWSLGFFATQMGNGPVKSERNFSSLGIPITISGDLKPIHFDFRIAVHLSGKKKDRGNQDE